MPFNGLIIAYSRQLFSVTSQIPIRARDRAVKRVYETFYFVRLQKYG